MIISELMRELSALDPNAIIVTRRQCECDRRGDYQEASTAGIIEVHPVSYAGYNSGFNLGATSSSSTGPAIKALIIDEMPF